MAELLRWKEPKHTRMDDSHEWLWNVVLIAATVWALWDVVSGRSSLVFLPLVLWMVTFQLKPLFRKRMHFVIAEKGVLIPPFEQIVWDDVEWFQLIAYEPPTNSASDDLYEENPKENEAGRPERTYLPGILHIKMKRKRYKWYQPDFGQGLRYHSISFDPREIDATKLRAILHQYVGVSRDMDAPVS